MNINEIKKQARKVREIIFFEIGGLRILGMGEVLVGGGDRGLMLRGSPPLPPILDNPEFSICQISVLTL